MVNALLNLKMSIEHIEEEFEAANQAEFEAEIAAECEAFKASAIAVPEGTAVPEANTEPASSSTKYVPLRSAKRRRIAYEMSSSDGLSSSSS